MEHHNIGRAMRTRVFGHIRTSAQSDQGIPCPLTVSLVAVECINEEQRPASRKHAYKILTPLNPTFIVKLGFTGVYIIFLISAQNIDCGYSLEPPRRGGSNEYQQSMFLAEI